MVKGKWSGPMDSHRDSMTQGQRGKACGTRGRARTCPALPCHLLYPITYSHMTIWTSVFSFVNGTLPSLRLPLQTGALELQVPGSRVDPETDIPRVSSHPGRWPTKIQLPSLRKEMTGGMPFTDTSTSANPVKAEFSNKINLLVWSVFCNFC